MCAGRFAPKQDYSSTPTYSKTGDCGPDGSPALGVVPVDSPAGRFYVDDRNFVLGNGTWIYQESNGTNPLERKNGTEATTSVQKLPANLGDDFESCTDMQGYTGKPDNLIF